MADAWQPRRSSLPDSLLFAGDEQDRLQPIEDLHKGTARWLHPQADASPMPWGASSAASDRSSIISKTNEKRRRSSMLSNPDSLLSLDDLSQPPGLPSKSHKRTASEGNLAGFSPLQSSPAFLPLSPRPVKRPARLEVGREPSPPLSISDSSRSPPQTPRFSHIRTNSFGALQPWDEGDSLDDAAVSHQPQQSSASRFAEANRAPSHSSAASPDHSLRRHVGIVGLGEGWAGGPQRDPKGKKIKFSKIAADDPLALWREEPVAGPSHVGLKSTSMRSFWGKSMQNLGFARSTTALPESALDGWDADARSTPESAGNKARKLLLRMSGQKRRSRKVDGDDRDQRRSSLHAFQYPIFAEQPQPIQRPLTSASVPSLLSSRDESIHSKRRQFGRRHSPLASTIDLSIPQRNSSLEGSSRVASSHPFLNPAMRVKNIPGGLPPSHRGRLDPTSQPPTVAEVDEGAETSPQKRIRPASAVYPRPSAAKQPFVRSSSLRHKSSNGTPDIASEIALQDALERDSLARAAVRYVALEEPVKAKAEDQSAEVQRRPSVLNRLFSRISSTSSPGGANVVTPSAVNADSFTSRSTSRASSRFTHGNTPSISSSTSASSKPSWSSLSRFKRAPGVNPQPKKTTVASRPTSFMDGLRSPSMLFLPSQRKVKDVSPPSTPDSSDYHLARTVVEEMLFVPSNSQTSAPAVSLGAPLAMANTQQDVAAHRLSRLSERDGESEMEVNIADAARRAPTFLEVDLGESGLGLAPDRTYSPPVPSTVTAQSRQPSIPVDLVDICKATSSADDLSAIVDTKLAFPLPPASPDVDSFEHLRTPREAVFASSLKGNAFFPVPNRKASNTSERRISEGYRDLLTKHRPSDSATVFSMLSDEGSDLEIAETHQAYLRPAPRSPMEGVHCQPVYVQPTLLLPAATRV